MAGKLVGACLVLACVAAVTARAGAFHGEIQTADGAARARHPEDVIVWLESVPDKVEQKLTGGGRHWFWQAARKPPAMAALTETGRHYAPRVSVVPAGQPLEIRNGDSVWHGTFSVSPGAAFELGKRAPGSVDTVHFASPGVVTLRCDIHPDMTGYVVVTPNHAYVRPDSSGVWRLPDLPAGDYVVHAWRPDRGETRRAAHMPAHGDTLVTLRW